MTTSSSNLDGTELSEPVRKKIAKLEQKLEYSNFLMKKLIADREQGTTSDLVYVKVGDRVFGCHRQILKSNSEYFSALFKDNFKDARENIKNLPLEYVSEPIFSKLLRAMYGEPLKIQDDVLPIFVASSYLQLTHFLSKTKEYIRCHMKVINASELIILPELKFDESLYSFVKKYVCRNFVGLQESMTKISLSLFEELFLDPGLFVLNKEQILRFGRDWIVYDLEHRREHLQKVCSILKPFHTPCDASSEFILNLRKHLQNECDVEMALNTLLDNRLDLNNEEKLGLDGKLSLFFVQPNEDSEVHIATYENAEWAQLKNLQLPVATDLLTASYNGVVANNSFYFLAELKLPDIIFRGLNTEKQGWIELMSPQKMAECLVSCNSTVYSYEHSSYDHQIASFEPVLNRWLKVAAVKYPVKKAGIVSDGYILYKIGGVTKYPFVASTLSSSSMIIEMYDSRCCNWSYIDVPSSSSYSEVIGNIPFCRKACFSNNVIYLCHGNKLARFDVRNQKWLLSNSHMYHTLSQDTSVSHLTAIGSSLYTISRYDAYYTVKEYNCSDLAYQRQIHNSNFLVKPISLPYSL